VEAVFAATFRARERALNGDGPTLIEALTMRMHGHAAHDEMRYVPRELLEHWQARDPIVRQQARLVERGVDVDEIRARVAAELDAALAWALEQPMPEPTSATEGVFCEVEADFGWLARGASRRRARLPTGRGHRDPWGHI
jgi:TPP-dependent pyruvate/acetoin dehydrogenase alpha subunit